MGIEKGGLWARFFVADLESTRRKKTSMNIQKGVFLRLSKRCEANLRCFQQICDLIAERRLTMKRPSLRLLGRKLKRMFIFPSRRAGPAPRALPQLGVLPV